MAVVVNMMYGDGGKEGDCGGYVVGSEWQRDDDGEVEKGVVVAVVTLINERWTEWWRECV